MKKYADILDQLLRSIEKRDGRNPSVVADQYKVATENGMCREGICQILSDEPLGVRLKMFCLYPELIISYLCRIRRTKKE